MRLSGSRNPLLIIMDYMGQYENATSELIVYRNTTNEGSNRMDKKVISDIHAAYFDQYQSHCASSGSS